jgi:hypothetical protein
MGWKASATGKRVVCASATAHGHASEPHTVAVDMNAILRKALGGLPASVSPRAAVALFWRRYVAAHPDAEVFYMAFDSPARIPAVRERFLATERYREPQAAPASWAITPDHTSLAYGAAFGSPAPKAAMWAALSTALWDHVMQAAAPGVAYIVDPPAGPLVAWPAAAGVAQTRYGEADLKVASFLARVAERALHYTIDWDAVVQGALVYQPGTVVAVGTVFKAGDAIHYTKAKACAGAARVPELIAPAALPGTADVSRRWSYTMVLLAIGGIDYCNGLKRYGYSERALTAHLAATVPDFVAVGARDGHRTVTLSVRGFQDWLLPLPPVRPRSKSLAELETELGRIWFCLLYLGLIDPGGERGGPAYDPDARFFPGAESATDALRVRRPYPDVVYTESAV